MTEPVASTSELGYVNGYAAEDKWTTELLHDERVPELQWPQSLDVYRRMSREDSRVSSVLSAITLPIRRAQWWIEPNGADPAVTKFVAECLGLPVRGEGGAPMSTVGRARNRFSWRRHLPDVLTGRLRYGHAYFEQVYRYDDGTGKMRLRKLAPRPQNTIHDIAVARDGGLVSITQNPPTGLLNFGGEKPIPVSSLVAYVRDADPGDWIGESILRPAYKHWLLKDEMMRIEAATARRNGMGLPVYFGSDDPDIKGTDMARGEALARSARAGMNAGAAVPAGADFRLLGVQGNLPDIRQSIEYHDKAIALSGLAHFLNLDRGGSYALASVQADTFVQSVQTEAEAVCDIANLHVVEDLVDINFGEDVQAPVLAFDEIGSRKDAVAAALQQLVASGILFPDRTLEESVRQAYGLPPKQTVPNDQLPTNPVADPSIEGSFSLGVD